MRETYRNDLDQIRASLAEMGGLAAWAIRTAGSGLESADPVQAQDVMSGDWQIDRIQEAVDC
jgi:phosphate uptake regulator